ncbi:methyl-accepting chemotaxis protein [Pantoea sp. 1.19]|uniref:methyl-accepting chemotaxis protein n=1 Tax=Pantoea sp. 1.19 TaxID=1925589 RepID=UPI0009489C24|nr:methyl-accepting chemotaxis protein [Pantoea sp. 1.19]
MILRSVTPETSAPLRFWQHVRLVPLFGTIFAAILLLFALSIGCASYFLLHSQQALKDATVEIGIHANLTDSANRLRSARLTIIRAAAAARIGDMDSFRANLAAGDALINEAASSIGHYLHRTGKTPAGIALDTPLRNAFDAYVQQGLAPMIAAARQGSFEGVISQETAQTNTLDDAFTALMHKAVAIRDDRARTINARAHAEARLGYIMMAAAFLAAALLTALTFLFLRRVVIHPLRDTVTRIEHIAQGDLTASPIRWGRSEIGVLGDNVQRMQQALAQTVRTVRDGAVAIYQGTGDITAGNSHLSSRTEQQAAALEQTAASMEQLTATVKQNAENAHHASQLAADASGKASRGGEIVAGVVSTMSNISASSKKIAEITNVINSIAFQTNILALNAAVEAARAGEQGRGFAVVASEVRSLAQRSAQAAKEIEGLIGESVTLISTGSGQVSQAGSTMGEIVDAVRRVTDIMGEIAAASDEQSRGIQQVSQAVSEMDNVTQQNATLVQQAASAAAALEAQAARLSEAVAAFHLGEPRLRPTPASVPLPPTHPELAQAPAQEHWETF